MIPSDSVQTSSDVPIAPLPPADTILQIRSGKIRPIGPAGVSSGINKLPHAGKVFISKTGIFGDEVQYEKHGGTEKALHHYCESHYASWQEEKPDKAHLFVVGGFGENLASSHLNEDNVCMGDVFRIGGTVRVVVTGPRIPCFKLQYRFEWDLTPVRAQQTNRTGWYYSVLQTGNIEPGDEMILLERPYPTWPVGRVSDVMFRNKQPTLYRDILQLEPLGADYRELLEERIAIDLRNLNGHAKAGPLDWKSYRLLSKTSIASRVKRFVFSINDTDSKHSEPKFGAFPFVRLWFGPEDRYDRAYSVVRGNKNEFELGIALDRKSRGGSRYLHESMEVGEHISIAIGREAIADDKIEQAIEASHRVFIVGGIGITAFVNEIERLVFQDASFEVHYACSSRDEAAYTELLPSDKTTYYAGNMGQRLKIEDIVPRLKPGDQNCNTMILCCGPAGLMQACQDTASSVGYPEHLQHYESFGADSGGEPFEVEISSSSQVLSVPGDKSLLQVLEEAGFPALSSCQVGNCGMCMITYKSGSVKHKGSALTHQQKCTTMLSCVSRGQGRVILDL